MSFSGSSVVNRINSRVLRAYLDLNSRLTDWAARSTTGWSLTAQGTVTHYASGFEESGPVDSGFTHLASSPAALTDPPTQMTVSPKVTITSTELVRARAWVRDSAASGNPIEIALLIYDSSDVLLGYFFQPWGNHSSTYELAEVVQPWLVTNQAKAAIGFRSAVNAVTVYVKGPTVSSAMFKTAPGLLVGLTAALTFTGALAKRGTRFVAGGLSFSSTFVETPIKALAGSLSFAGALARRTTKVLAAAVGFSGALTALRLIPKSLTGALSFTGAVSRVVSKALAGAVSFSGATASQKIATRAFTASVDFVGTLSKQGRKTLNGALSFSGAMLKMVPRAFSGALSFSGALTRQALRALTASVGFSGAMSRQTRKAMTASVSFAGALPRVTRKALTASVGFAGTLAAQARKVMVASLTFAGSLTKTVPRALSGAVGFSGALAKRTQKALSGAVGFATTLSMDGLAIPKFLTASVGFSGGLQKATGRTLTAQLSFVGVLGRKAFRSLSASLSFAGSLQKSARRALSANLGFAGAMSKVTVRTLGSSLTFATSMTKRTAKAFTASLSFVGTLVQRLQWIQVQLAVLPNIITAAHWAFRSIGVAVTEAVDVVLRHTQNAVRHETYHRIQIAVKGPQEMAYKRGTNVLFEATFTDKDGLNFDPDTGTARIYVKKPDGTYMTGYDPAVGNGAAMTKMSTGVYQKDVQFARTDPVGQYEIEVQGTVGTKTSLDSVKINVRA